MLMADSDKDYEEFKREKTEIARKVQGLTVGGLVGTVLLLGWAICYAVSHREAMNAMKPNEWGDFLAGWLGPIGVLWLIVGYFQQGLELRQNTRALETQAKELKDQVTQLKGSVDQQKDLVLATQEQIKLERERQQREEQLRFQEAQPRIVLEDNSVNHRDNQTLVLYMRLRNIGSEVTDVAIHTQPNLGMKPQQWPRWANQSNQEIVWESSIEIADIIVYVNIVYVDGLGKPQSQKFELVHSRIKSDPDPRAISLVFRPSTQQ